ncbi:hypothetical protein PV797_11220 [Clostridiaceae bacterium M8S5]|nr:hypothetical protein PV797_11220 [Clostridiaceae bacterium M8S5]
MKNSIDELIEKMKEFFSLTKNEEETIRSVITIYGVRTFIFNIEEYDLRKEIKEQIMCFRSIIQELDKTSRNDIPESSDI